MKRAVIIITDAISAYVIEERDEGHPRNGHGGYVTLSEQLLADLTAAAEACDFVANELERVSNGRSMNTGLWRERAARVRAAIGDNDAPRT